jgi:hypothetical protein
MISPIHPGRVIHVWDHFVLDLAGDGRSAFLSLYAITYSPSVGEGHVALLSFDIGGGGRDHLMCDDLETGLRMRERLRSIGYARSSLDVEPSSARFTYAATARQLMWRIESDHSTVVGTWARLAPAFQMSAPAPRLVSDEDITAVFVEAGHGRLEVDESSIEADVESDESWIPKVGRALLASHAALAEVRVRPAAG